MSSARLLLPLLLAGVARAASAQPHVDLDSITRQGSIFLADLEGGGAAELTLSSGLQDAVDEVLARYEVPFGAAVALSIPDGRVLALAGRSSQDPSLGPAELALRPWAPAASVFKIVAVSALVGEASLSASTRACYHGGVHAVLPENLLDLPRLDRRCATLGYGLGKSQNAIIAKLAAKHLEPAGLLRMASAFGFGQPIAFDAAVEPSEIDVPQDPLEFARTAAGFWHSSLSPLHGALMAAAVANGGEMPAPRLVERALDAEGRPLVLTRRPARRVLAPEVAREVGRMMELTTTMGTARHTFQDRRGRPYLPVDVAGKTGTLFYRGNPQDPPLPAAVLPDGGFLGYSWFVGYAPARQPRIAFAVVIGNPRDWKIKATFVARRIVAEYLSLHAARVVASR
ncbi:MAG TPA: penicillin-binding transpeptidase domain-containing protein [Polyangia bacterium]|nr:penicillin-binding transpeptidase domain-containing protein [Polyangia bacterium]